jgi:hypothetical protein
VKRADRLSTGTVGNFRVLWQPPFLQGQWADACGQ